MSDDLNPSLQNNNDESPSLINPPLEEPVEEPQYTAPTHNSLNIEELINDIFCIRRNKDLIARYAFKVNKKKYDTDKASNPNTVWTSLLDDTFINNKSVEFLQFGDFIFDEGVVVTKTDTSVTPPTSTDVPLTKLQSVLVNYCCRYRLSDALARLTVNDLLLDANAYKDWFNLYQEKRETITEGDKTYVKTTYPITPLFNAISDSGIVITYDIEDPTISNDSIVIADYSSLLPNQKNVTVTENTTLGVRNINAKNVSFVSEKNTDQSNKYTFTLNGTGKIKLDDCSFNTKEVTVSAPTANDSDIYINNTDFVGEKVTINCAENVQLTGNNGEFINSNKVQVTGKNISVNDYAFITNTTTGSGVAITLNSTDTNGTVTVKDISLTGKFTGASGTGLFYIYANGDVVVRDCNFNCDSYDTLGFMNIPKNITVDNCVFEGDISRNVINSWKIQNNGRITIKNCKFNYTGEANALRFDNTTRSSTTTDVATNVVLTFDNCEFNNMCVGAESDPNRYKYSGFLMLQCEGASNSANIDVNRFSPSNLRVIVSNCKVNGKLIKPTDASTICGTNNENQLIYVYTTQVEPYSSGMYPEIEIH